MQSPSSKLAAALQCESWEGSNAQEELNPEMGAWSPDTGHTDRVVELELELLTAPHSGLLVGALRPLAFLS